MYDKAAEQLIRKLPSIAGNQRRSDIIDKPDANALPVSTSLGN
jgi:LPS-assembly lipoprotein